MAVCQATATGSPCAPLATIYTDATLTLVSGVYVLNGFAGSGGQGAAIKIDAGALQNCHVFGGGLAVVSVIDGDGNPIGGRSVQSANGFDYVVGTSNVDRLRNDLFTAGDKMVQPSARRRREAGSLRWPSIRPLLREASRWRPARRR